MMSLKTIPGSGKSGTSRILAFEVVDSHQWPATCRRSRQKSSCESSCASSARVCSCWTAASRRSAFRERSAGATSCSSRPGLAVGRRAERAQVARRDPEARELRAGDRDLDVAGRIELLAALAARLQEAELLELARQLGRDRRALAELAEIELVVRVGEADRAPAPALLAGTRRRGELLADHAQRQELVALQAQDRLQPLDVVLAEEPVAALRSGAARAGPGPRGSGSSRSRCRGTRPAAGGRPSRS